MGETETRANLEDYVSKFSENARQCFDHFNFTYWLDRLTEANLLFLVVQKFASIDLHIKVISNHEMGNIFEELIRRFTESSNETAGEHFTPRDVVRLATTQVFHIWKGIYTMYETVYTMLRASMDLGNTGSLFHACDFGASSDGWVGFPRCLFFPS